MPPALPTTSLWPLPAQEAARLTGGELLGSATALGERVLTDSRSGVRAGDLFVGLVGPHFEGGRFAAAALAEGAAIALVGPGPELAPGTGQAVVVVADPLAALQALAAEARRRFRGRVLAITGSNGKTTVKDMLVAILGPERRVTASPQSYNSQVGVALSLLGLDPEAELAVLECGLSLPGEMARLEAMVRPDLGILTMIGDAHLEGLGSRERIAEEKSRLFAGLAGARPGSAWVLTGHEEARARAALGALGVPVATVGGAGADALLDPAASPQRLIFGEQTVRLALAEAAPHWLADAALAATAALRLGLEPATIERGLAAWHPAPMRLEITSTPRGLLLLNDAYAADPVSMEAALVALARERGRGGARGRRHGAAVAVLGGMAQLGPARAAAHERVGQRLVELGVERLIGVGEGGAEIAAAALAAGFPASAVHVVPGAAEAAALLDEHCRPGDRVLLKASRPERLERVAALMLDSVAPARLYVDLDELLGNYHRIRQAAPGCAVMAVVKSFGYGLDAVRISRALEQAGVEHLAVAYPDEGVLLRDQGITAPILVQNLLLGEVDKVVRFGLSAELTHPEQALTLAAEAERQQRAVRVHLKVDSGMGRAGAAPEGIVALANLVAASPWLVLEGLMTHFAAADDPAADAFTRAQVATFDEARARLAAAGHRFRWEHAAASAAIARFPEARYSMVRTGLGLFGYARVGAPASLDQRPVLRLTTQVIAVKALPAGAAIGYGRTFHTTVPSRIALVALGYSDGYPWALSNRGWMLVRGARCPVVGRVSMDVVTLDVSALGERVVPGDEVVVFGPGADEPSLLELAELAGTIPYELLTRLSSRVRRIFRASR